MFVLAVDAYRGYKTSSHSILATTSKCELHSTQLQQQFPFLWRKSPRYSGSNSCMVITLWLVTRSIAEHSNVSELLFATLNSTCLGVYAFTRIPCFSSVPFSKSTYSPLSHLNPKRFIYSSGFQSEEIPVIRITNNGNHFRLGACLFLTFSGFLLQFFNRTTVFLPSHVRLQA